MVKVIQIKTSGQGLYEITDMVQSVVSESRLNEGLCTVYIQHTSASLLIQENADPSVQRDVQNWFARLVQERDSLYTHTCEGPDDMPSHLKSALTQTSIGIPIMKGHLALGTWQGIYVFEHRDGSHKRSVVVHVGG